MFTVPFNVQLSEDAEVRKEELCSIAWMLFCCAEHVDSSYAGDAPLAQKNQQLMHSIVDNLREQLSDAEYASLSEVLVRVHSKAVEVDEDVESNRALSSNESDADQRTARGSARRISQQTAYDYAGIIRSHRL